MDGREDGVKVFGAFVEDPGPTTQRCNCFTAFKSERNQLKFFLVRGRRNEGFGNRGFILVYACKSPEPPDGR